MMKFVSLMVLAVALVAAPVVAKGGADCKGGVCPVKQCKKCNKDKKNCSCPKKAKKAKAPRAAKKAKKEVKK